MIVTVRKWQPANGDGEICHTEGREYVSVVGGGVPPLSASGSKESEYRKYFNKGTGLMASQENT